MITIVLGRKISIVADMRYFDVQSDQETRTGRRDHRGCGVLLREREGVDPRSVSLDGTLERLPGVAAIGA
jgi:hypothetical protein